MLIKEIGSELNEEKQEDYVLKGEFTKNIEKYDELLEKLKNISHD